MKKLFKFLFLFAFVLIPVNTFALSFSLGDFKSRTDAGDMYASLYITVTGDESVTTKPTITCDATKNVTCSADVNEPPYSSSDAQVATINIKNTTDQDLSDVTVIVTVDVNGEKTKQQATVNIKAGSSPKSTNSKLKSLKTNVGTWNLQFSSDTYEYTIYDISDSIRRVIFTPTCAEGDCRVSYEGGVGANSNSVELANGSNEVKVIVKSEATDSKETTTTYKLNIIRGTSAYNSNKLKSLVVGQYELSPEFKSDVLEYTVKIPKKLTNITSLLKAEAEDSEATIKIEGDSTLDQDENEVTITVTGRDGQKSIYKLKVVREDEVQAVIDVIGYKDNKVSFIDTEGASQTLSEDEFKEQYPEEWAKILDGTYKFDEDGNIIRNTDANSESTDTKKKNSFPWIIVILIVVAIIIIAVAGYFIFRDPEAAKKKKNAKKTTEENKEEITEEQQEELNDIDSYNEEARLIAEDNQRNENPLLDEDKEEIIPETESTLEDITEEVVREETIDEYVDEEKSATMDIDEALSDLMNTKEYNFKDK